MLFRAIQAALPAALLVFCAVAASAEPLPAVQAIALQGAPKYAAGFSHFDYVNPEAPKGGSLRLASETPFDSLNGFIVKGVPAPGIGMVFETLMTGSEDEPFSRYGALAESVEMPEDRGFVVFNLNKAAKWHDGKPVTADDVVWTFGTLMKDGHPHYRAYYAHVKEAVAEGPHRVKFTFDMTGNRELPFIVSELPVLPKHYWAGKDFSRTSLEPPLGSGPYRVKSVEPGRRIVYERVQDWWGRDLPANRGRFNFDTISYDVYRDASVRLQALFSGEYDLRIENTAKDWASEYDNRPPVRAGLIRKEEIKHENPAGMQGFIFNIRRPVFEDARVREALGLAFDFEWSNRQFAHGTYTRTDSYFENSELASSGVPEGRELEILEPYRAQLPAQLFTTPFTVPKTDGSGRPRENLARAKQLLADAGWTMGRKGILEKGGKPFKFEFVTNTEAFERWVLPFVANLKKLGVEARFRVVDTAQYQQRMDEFDFDMTEKVFAQSLSPGNEQLDFWGSSKADVKGSRNLIGIKNPVVDELVKLVIAAPDRAELVARTRALDRVLLWNHYVIPNWHYGAWRVAYWDKFGRPAVPARYDPGIADTWWHDAAKAARVEGKTKPAGKE